MSASVVTTRPEPEDEDTRIMVECLTCGIEWGWCPATRANMLDLRDMAAHHNAVFHERGGA